MDTNLKNKIILQNISVLISVGLAFLMPIFFLATTTEFFEYNKLALLIGATIILIILWAGRILLGQKIEIVKSPLDFPLALITILAVITTLFSINKVTSIYGSQGRWFPSLVGIIVMLTYFYISTPNLKDAIVAKWSVLALIAGATVSTVVAILSYYKIFIGAENYFKTANFTLTGSVTTAIVLAALATTLAIGLLAKEKLIPLKTLLAVSVIVNFSYIALTSTIIGWTLLTIGVITTLAFTGIKAIKAEQTMFIIVATIVIGIFALTILPTTQKLVKNTAYPFENTLPIRESWVIASATIQDYPLLATGLSTFAIDFTRYKPMAINNTPMWNIRFDKPYNEIFNILSTTGIIGLLLSVFLATKIIKVSLVSKDFEDSDNLSKTISSAVIVMLCVYLFTYATILNTFVLVALVGLLIAINANKAPNISELVSFSFASFSNATTTIGETNAVKKEYMNLIMVLPILAAALYGGFLFYKTYAAEYYMRKSIESAINGKATDTYDYQTKAININPTRDAYQTAYAQTNLALANVIAGKQNLTDADKQTIQTLIAQSIKSIRVATEMNNPLNVTNWETRALIYRSLINVAENASEWTIGSYNTAIQLDPTNPVLRVDLGGVYFTNKDYLSAANLFRQAATIKPDYANAHYNFAQALIQLKDYENAKKELLVVQSLVPQESEDFKKVGTEIAALDAQNANVAGAATTKPTIEQITGANGQAGQTGAQAPLTSPSQTTNGSELKQDVLPVSGN